MQAALDGDWPLVDELFLADPVTAALPGVAADPAAARAEIDAVLDAVLADGDAGPAGHRAAGRRSRAAPAGTACTPRRWVRARRAAERGPGPPGRDMVSPAGTRLAAARRIAAGIPDPELPMLTLADLGILRDVRMDDGSLVVTITPTYSGCPAMREIARDLHGALTEAGFGPVTVRTAAGAGLDHRLDHRRGPPQAGRRRHRAARHRPAPAARSR